MIGLNAQSESHDEEVEDEEGVEHGEVAEGVVGEVGAGAAGGQDEVALAGGGRGNSMDPLTEEMACVGVQQEGLVVQTCGPYRHNAVL